MPEGDLSTLKKKNIKNQHTPLFVPKNRLCLKISLRVESTLSILWTVCMCLGKRNLRSACGECIVHILNTCGAVGGNTWFRAWSRQLTSDLCLTAVQRMCRLLFSLIFVLRTKACLQGWETLVFLSTDLY